MAGPVLFPYSSNGVLWLQRRTCFYTTFYKNEDFFNVINYAFSPTCNNVTLCRFNGKEKDYESGFHYYGARYYWGESLTGWLSVDPLADKYPGISPYAYCAWNPVKLVDPDGRWIWNKVGDLVAQKGDNINTMSTFLGTSIENCATILNRCGLITASGVNIEAGCTLPEGNLWIDAPTSSEYPTVDNNISAVWHYYFGGGTSVNIGDASTSLLYKSTEFQEKHKRIILNSQKNDGDLSVNMTGIMFHIGRTNVKYTKSKGQNTSTITYSAFSNDGFWDPAFASEHTLGKWGIGGDLYKPDKKGGHLELGGSPYDYIPRERTYFYKPEE